MLAYLENYFDLRKSFVFYGAYHHKWPNQMIHVIFVPAIFTTAMSFLAHVRISGEVNLSHIITAFYVVSFIKMEPIAGTLYAPMVAFMEYLGSRVLINHVPASIGIHVLSWAAQIVGHKFIEGRQPAFMEDPLQAIHAAVFFVWLEVLFFLGYRPSMKAELEKMIEERVAQMSAMMKADKVPSVVEAPKRKM